MKSIIKEKVLTKQQQIALNAKRLPQTCFTSLAHHMNLGWLYEAYRQTRKDGAVGIDGVTAEDYEKNLKVNLENLLNKAKTGRYIAPPVRRVYIEKLRSKEMRPLGIPTFEDKVLQRAVKMILEPLYEQDFYDFSFGFRPGKSPHDALEYLRDNAMKTNGWIIDLDIRKYFDSIDHAKLREILRLRMNDGVINRLIGKWLNAGIMEKDNISYGESGSPQGGVISPLLSNIFLHEILDKWFVKDVKPRMKGNSFLVRFADDAILGFEKRADAEKVFTVLFKRFEKYGLKLHPEKTKLITCRHQNNSDTKTGTFDYLGFTHYWGITRKGNYAIKKKTAKSRFARALKKISLWCNVNRHESIKEQYKNLTVKLIGHYNYYGVTGNYYSILEYKHQVIAIWKKWLNKRSRERKCDWNKMSKILKRYKLPAPRIYHSYISLAKL